jgi:hypothetical protein
MLAADGAYECLCAAAVTKALSIGHGCAGVSLRALSVLDSREAPRSRHMLLMNCQFFTVMQQVLHELLMV